MDGPEMGIGVESLYKTRRGAAVKVNLPTHTPPSLSRHGHGSPTAASERDRTHQGNGATPPSSAPPPGPLAQTTWQEKRRYTVRDTALQRTSESDGAVAPGAGVGVAPANVHTSVVSRVHEHSPSRSHE